MPLQRHRQTQKKSDNGVAIGCANDQSAIICVGDGGAGGNCFNEAPIPAGNLPIDIIALSTGNLCPCNSDAVGRRFGRGKGWGGQVAIGEARSVKAGELAARRCSNGIGINGVVGDSSIGEGGCAAHGNTTPAGVAGLSVDTVALGTGNCVPGDPDPVGSVADGL